MANPLLYGKVIKAGAKAFDYKLSPLQEKLLDPVGAAKDYLVSKAEQAMGVPKDTIGAVTDPKGFAGNVLKDTAKDYFKEKGEIPEEDRSRPDSSNSGSRESADDFGGCPAPWINILMADNGLVKAGDIKPGMQVYTRHETTNEWGVYPVTAVEMGEDNRWEVVLEDGRTFVGTFNHRVRTDNNWTEIRNLKAGDKLVQPDGFGIVKSSQHLDHGPIVKITVGEAHTYISEGFLSHNVKMVDFGGGGKEQFDEIGMSMTAYKRGGKVKASTASRRGDGIAQRGKTKGRYL